MRDVIRQQRATTENQWARSLSRGKEAMWAAEEGEGGLPRTRFQLLMRSDCQGARSTERRNQHALYPMDHVFIVGHTDTQGLSYSETTWYLTSLNLSTLLRRFYYILYIAYF